MTGVLLFWFCFDDTLARLSETPGLGHVPFLMWFWITLVCMLSTGSSTAASRS